MSEKADTDEDNESDRFSQCSDKEAWIRRYDEGIKNFRKIANYLENALAQNGNVESNDVRVETRKSTGEDDDEIALITPVKEHQIE